MKGTAKMSFEKSLKSLENIVKKLEDNKITLEESIAAYQQGVKLLAECKKQLETARQSVTEETVPDDGEEDTAESESFEDENGDDDDEILPF